MMPNNNKLTLISFTFHSADSGRYSILSTGELLIRNTSFSDAASYKCQVRHTLTDELRTSEEAGRLIVTGKCRFTLFSLSLLLYFLRSLHLTTGFRFAVPAASSALIAVTYGGQWPFACFPSLTHTPIHIPPHSLSQTNGSLRWHIFSKCFAQLF